jgi:methionyl-tRNA synthetase
MKKQTLYYCVRCREYRPGKYCKGTLDKAHTKNKCVETAAVTAQDAIDAVRDEMKQTQPSFASLLTRFQSLGK